MGWWKELPYRGDGQSRNKKPRRRFRNLRRERQELIISIFIVIAFFSIPLSLVIFGQSPYDGNGTSKVGSLVVGVLLILTLIVGILSIYKFRKGYDVDISDEEEKDDHNPPKNLID